MRSILIILAVAVLAIGVSVAISPHKQLDPAPQDTAAIRKDAEIGAEQKKAAEEQRKKAGVPPVNPTFNPPREGAVTVDMSIEGRGNVTLELYPKAAPKTVARFTELCRSGFYNGIRFHRVEEGSLVQAGDPNSKKYSASDMATAEDAAKLGLGSSGSGKNIPFEDNTLPNVTGTIAMALSGPHTDTADSQFYINMTDNPMLNGQYCVFGRVVNGMDVLQNVKRGDAITSMAVK